MVRSELECLKIERPRMIHTPIARTSSYRKALKNTISHLPGRQVLRGESRMRYCTKYLVEKH